MILISLISLARNMNGMRGYSICEKAKRDDPGQVNNGYNWVLSVNTS